MIRAVWVVAHPDDETIFFGGLIRRLVRAGVAAEVVCVTSTFATGTLTSIRRAEFRRACHALGARGRLLPLVDGPDRLDEGELMDRLGRVRLDANDLVFSHGVWGEYGHPHHIQVSRAVHQLAPRVWSLAGPFPTARRYRLGPLALSAKRTLAADVYRSQPFATDWCTDEENLVHWSSEDACYLSGLGLDGQIPGQRRPLPGPINAQVIAGSFADVAHIPPAVWRTGHQARRGLIGRPITMEPARR